MTFLFRLPPLAALIAILGITQAGCRNRMWWDYRDDPYISTMSGSGEPEILRHVNSVNKEDRLIALRVLADNSARFRREGAKADADRLVGIVLHRYLIERDTDVRASVVRICAPAMGRGSTPTVRFLRDRIAAGEFPGYAAMALAALGPRDAFLDIEPMTRHPDPGVRLQAAEALTVLQDPRGIEAVARVLRGMDTDGTWPDRVDGIPLEDARTALESRARRSFGRPLE